MPVDLMYGTPVVNPASVPEYVANQCASLTTAVQTTISSKLERQEFYDRKAHGQPFEKGHLVWVHNPAATRGHKRKLHCPWTGPYRVTGRLSEAVYHVQHTRVRWKRVVVHFDQLKQCSPGVCVQPPSAEQHSGNSQARQRPLSVGTDLKLLDLPTPTPGDRVIPSRPLHKDTPLAGGDASPRPAVNSSSPSVPQPLRYPDGHGHNPNAIAQRSCIEFMTNSPWEGELSNKCLFGCTISSYVIHCKSECSCTYKYCMYKYHVVILIYKESVERPGRV